jgi:prephenate dehydrogenase
MKRLAVFGFGLIGASVAAAVRKAAPAVEIIAIDRPSTLGTPEVGALSDEQVDSADRAGVQSAASAADLCLLAAPVSVIESALPALLEASQVVSDCGSTKRSICARIAGLPRAGRFVPGHPMAGGPEGGAVRARAELFQGQTWLLCPENSDADAVARVEQLIQWVGARSVHLTVAAHDRAVAYTSHAPQLLASALSVLAERAGAVPAAGPAYRATTRSAGGAEVMWRDIFAANADQISIVLRELIAELSAVADRLDASPRDVSAALELLASARSARRR